jgi:thiosulfate/3-mercaptopyruvate sulfurtransferase
MMTSSLVDAAWLASALVNEPTLRVIDIRWYLQGKNGKDEYAAGHIAGAVFVDLADITADEGPGRHPIPGPEKFSLAMRRAGVSATTHVVAYDDAGGSIAARLWWLLRRYGHQRVSVLDGGLAAWTQAGNAVTTDVVSVPEGDFQAHLDASVSAVDKRYVDEARSKSHVLILDARAAERYRGDVEPIDRRPGHIPGAKSAPWNANLRDGRFASESELRAHYQALGADAAEEIIVYCGSGVTACHDLMALERAGRTGTLYEGSWSDWAADESLPAEKGEP